MNHMWCQLAQSALDNSWQNRLRQRNSVSFHKIKTIILQQKYIFFKIVKAYDISKGNEVVGTQKGI